MLLTVPATDPVTVAACGDPVYVAGEFVTDSVGVAFAMTKLPAAAPVREA